MRPLAGRLSPLAIIHHVGRKSGRRHRTPVLAFPTDDGFLTPLPYGTDTDWCLNWIETGEGFVEVAGHRTAVEDPRIVSADEALPRCPRRRFSHAIGDQIARSRSKLGPARPPGSLI